MAKVRFLVNPTAGGGKGRRALPRLRQMADASESELLVSRDARDLVSQARRAAQEGVERLIVAGGDGTFHHAVQGLAATECALGLVPLGRGNDLANTLGIEPLLEAAIRHALQGSTRRIDLGQLGDRCFAVYCGVGFDSEVAHFVHQKSRHILGRAVYPYGVLRTLAKFVPPELDVEYDGGRLRGRAMFAVASNRPVFGGGMRIAPEAQVADGQFDLVIAKEISRLQLLRVFPKVYKGRHVGHPAIAVVRTGRARIALDRRMTMFCDGEPALEAGPEGTEITVLPGALRVVAE
jgi:diacylglycerol kinase (ATP)